MALTAKVGGAVLMVLLAWAFYFHQTGDAFFFHTVPEGHVGVYKRFGAILRDTTEPGLHFMNPFTTTVDMIQITLQTDTVANIPCGTSGGVNIYFDKIEVVNRLDKNHVFSTVKDYGVGYDKVWIFDKIHHEINQFCSSHTLHEVYIGLFDKLDESLAQALQRDCDKYDTGISIIAIRVTKPNIPAPILKEFQNVEERKAKLLVLEQESQTTRRAAETKSMEAQIEAEKSAKVAKIDAEKEASISKIRQQQKTAEVEAEAERKALVSRIHQGQLTAETKQTAERQRVEHEVKMEIERGRNLLWYENALKEVEIQQKKYSPEYLQLRFYEETSKALGQNTKIYFGEKIPKLLMTLLPTDLKSMVSEEQNQSPAPPSVEEPKLDDL